MGRRLLLVPLIVLLAGCGSAATQPRDGGDPAEAELRAVDRPAPEAYEEWLNPTYELVVTSSSYCVPPEGEDATEDDSCFGGKTWDRCVEPEDAAAEPGCEPYQQQLDRIREEYEQARRAIAPAPGTEPRTVAELAVGDRKAELVAWRTADEKLCTFARVKPGLDGWDARLVGECVLYVPCNAKTCLETLAADARHFVLAGTVPRSAEAVKVTTAAGETTLFPLGGPVVDGSERRALLVDLGSDMWRQLDVLGDARVVETVEPGPGQVELFPCLHLMPKDATGSTDRFLECTNAVEAPSDDIDLEPLPDTDEEGEAPDAE